MARLRRIAGVGACILVAGLSLQVATAAAARADTYVIDKNHTEVRFVWGHLGLSRQGGRFLDVQGKVEFDPAKPEASSVDVTIPLSGLSTGVKELDRQLVESKEYFDAAAHPAITFRSTSVVVQGERNALVMGDLAMNGISRPVTLEVGWNFTGEHPLAKINPTYKDFYSSGFSATTQIRRSDWGLTRAIPYVSDEIRITIETEMHREGGPPPAPDAKAGTEAAPPADLAPGPSQAGDGLGDETVDNPL